MLIHYGAPCTSNPEPLICCTFRSYCISARGYTFAHSLPHSTSCCCCLCECIPALVTFLSLLVLSLLWAAPLSLPFPYPRALSLHVRFYPTTFHSTIEMFLLEPACAGMAAPHRQLSREDHKGQRRAMASQTKKPRRGFRSKQIVLLWWNRTPPTLKARRSIDTVVHLNL